MTFTNDQILKFIKKANKNSDKLTHITDKSKLSTEDKVKLSLCKHFAQYAVEHRMPMNKMAKLFGIPAPRLSEIVNYKIDKFTVDQLIKNLTLLGNKDAKIKAYLDLFEQVARIPTLKVSDTKKLSKKMRLMSDSMILTNSN